MKVARIGIDLAKDVFEIHGVDDRDNAVIRKTLRREEVRRFFANMPPCLIANRPDDNHRNRRRHDHLRKASRGGAEISRAVSR